MTTRARWLSAIPLAVVAAQLGGDRRVELLAVDRRQHPGRGGEFGVRRVGGHQDVGGGVLALGDQPLAQFGVVAGREAHLDAGVLGELLEDRFDAVVTAGVDGHGVGVVGGFDGAFDLLRPAVAAAGREDHRSEQHPTHWFVLHAFAS